MPFDSFGLVADDRVERVRAEQILNGFVRERLGHDARKLAEPRQNRCRRVRTGARAARDSNKIAIDRRR